MITILNWNKRLFFDEKINKKKVKNVVSNDILSRYHSFSGNVTLISGICLSFKSKKKGKLTYAMIVKDLKLNYYVNFPIFLGSAFRFKVIGSTYVKNISCSRLTSSRY